MDLASLGAVAPGMQQGQLNLQAIQQRAQQIQQGQMALDAAKRELAGQAAVFKGLMTGGAGGAAPIPPGAPQQPPPMTGQPPMPGQSSHPMMHPGQMPPQGMPPAGPQMAPTGPQPAPQAVPAPVGMQMTPQGQGGAGSPDMSPEGEMQVIAQIARAIKTQNPDIDGPTLFEAVKQHISLLGALSATQKQNLIFAANQLRADVSRENTQDRVAAQLRGQDIGAQNVDKRVGAQRDIAAGHDATSRANAMDRIAAAEANLKFTQDNINRRFAAGQGTKEQKAAAQERLALLKTNLAQAKDRRARAVAQSNQPEIDKGNAEVDRIYNQIVDFQKKMGGAPAPAAAAGAAAPRGPAPAKLNGKPIWPSPDGQHWVYEDGSEAK